jgi:hypothetical protein
LLVILFTGHERACANPHIFLLRSALLALSTGIHSVREGRTWRSYFVPGWREDRVRLPFLACAASLLAMILSTLIALVTFRIIPGEIYITHATETASRLRDGGPDVVRAMDDILNSSPLSGVLSARTLVYDVALPLLEVAEPSNPAYASRGE